MLFSQTERMLLEKELDKEYAGIMGFESFRKAAVQLAFGPGFDFIENGLVNTSLYSYIYLLNICIIFLVYYSSNYFWNWSFATCS